MALKYIIETFTRELGGQLVNQRPLLLARINQAAKELYESTDLPGSLREATFSITSQLIITLPYYVGPIKAMRHNVSKYKVELKDMAPKYSYQPWIQDWNNWRVMPNSPLARSIENAALPIVFSISEVDDIDISITIVGSTASATRARETVTIAAGETEVQATELFTDIISITKNKTNNRDITVTGADADAAEITLATIPNDRLEATYTVVDVSQYPSLSASAMDVLWKMPLYEMKYDGDTFPVEGFDDAIVYKALHLYYANQADGGEKAIGYFNKVNQIVFERTNHVTGAVQKEITFAPCSYFNLIPRRSPAGYLNRRYAR